MVPHLNGYISTFSRGLRKKTIKMGKILSRREICARGEEMKIIIIIAILALLRPCISEFIEHHWHSLRNTGITFRESDLIANALCFGGFALAMGYAIGSATCK
jgi:hypothetical protein